MNLNSVSTVWREEYFELILASDYVLFYSRFSGNGQYSTNWWGGYFTGGAMRFNTKIMDFMKNEDIQPIEINKLED